MVICLIKDGERLTMIDNVSSSAIQSNVLNSIIDALNNNSVDLILSNFSVTIPQSRFDWLGSDVVMTWWWIPGGSWCWLTFNLFNVIPSLAPTQNTTLITTADWEQWAGPSIGPNRLTYAVGHMHPNLATPNQARLMFASMSFPTTANFVIRFAAAGGGLSTNTTASPVFLHNVFIPLTSKTPSNGAIPANAT